MRGLFRKAEAASLSPAADRMASADSLRESDKIVLYPGNAIADGMKVKPRPV